MKKISGPTKADHPSMERIEYRGTAEEIRNKNRDKNKMGKEYPRDNPFPFSQSRLVIPFRKTQVEKEPTARQQRGGSPPPSLPADCFFGKKGLDAKVCKKRLQSQNQHAKGKNPMHKRPVVPENPKTGQPHAKEGCTKMKKGIKRHSFFSSFLLIFRSRPIAPVSTTTNTDQLIITCGRCSAITGLM